jgi:hypothetical protein
MTVYIRHGFLISLALLLGACSGATGASTPSSASQSSATSPGATHEFFQKIPMHPDAKAPALLMNFVTNGPAQGGVPCIACVNGASSNDTIGLTGPSSYVPSGAVWQYTLSFTDISYKGKCTIDFTIANGKTKIDSFSASFSLTSDGGFLVYGIDRNRPKYSGPATLTGSYTCGKNTGSAQAPLQFQ